MCLQGNSIFYRIAWEKWPIIVQHDKMWFQSELLNYLNMQHDSHNHWTIAASVEDVDYEISFGISLLLEYEKTLNVSLPYIFACYAMVESNNIMEWIPWWGNICFTISQRHLICLHNPCANHNNRIIHETYDWPIILNLAKPTGATLVWILQKFPRVSLLL